MAKQIKVIKCPQCGNSKPTAIGKEHWQWLPFVESKTSEINPNCENAKLWLKTLKMN